MFDLTERRAVVTGLAGGVAGAIALELAERGCEVGFLNQKANGAETLRSRIGTLGRRCVVEQTDLTSGQSVGRAVEGVVSGLGGVDLLVNSTEMFQDGFILDVSEEQWDQMLAVNLKSVFLCSKATIPHMLRQRGGRIVNVSSLNGKDPTPPAAVNYSASKAGVIGFTRQLARQLAPHGITVNAVAPLLPTESPVSTAAALIERIPLGRYASPEDVAKSVTFLASDESGFITGETLDLSSGLYKY